MLVTFTCEAHGDVTQFGDVAERLLRMMGQSGTIPGAIYAKDVPVVLERLKDAVNAEKEAPSEGVTIDTNDNVQDEPSVNIAVRAFPLIEMLTAAVEADCNVMWYKK